MAFILKDRVKESTVTTGTGNLSLAGAAATFDTFQSYLSNGDTTFYAVVHTSSGVDEWEVGLATWNTGNTLSRTTVLSGSNGTSAVNLSSGSKDIFMTLPADKLLHLDANGDVDINGGTIDGTVIGAAQAAASNFTTIDATGNVSVGGQLDVSEWIDLSAQASHPAHGEGRLWYDNVHKTLNYYSDDAGVVHELGIEEHARVYNETGSTLSKGTPVHFAGTKTSNGTYVPTVAAANATSSTKYKSEGMVAADIANNSYGYIITAGRLEGIDTSHLSIGQFFTGITDGSTQTAAPVYPNFPMCLGFVVRSDATNGVVFLAQQNHSIKSFRVQMDQHIGGSLTIDGDLNVTGSTNTTSTSDVTAGAPFYRANEGDAIGDANTTFSGSGLDDAFFAGHFTGTASTNYYVKIDGVGTPDTFAVSTDNFSTTISTGNAITGSEQMIHSADNISVKFGATTGHTLNDVWTGTASPINVDTGFFSNRNTGTSGVGYTHMGLFYDASESKWRLVDEYDPVPAGTIDTGHSSYVTGTIAANLEGNVTGNITGNVSGNAATASALESARTIGGVSFDGTANIDLAGVNTAGNQDTTGNAATATALENARTIQVSGDVTGSASFDGTSDINITTTVQDDSHAHVISNVDGLQTALDAKVPTSRTITAGNGLTGGGDLSANRTLTVGGGTGITVNADDIAIDSSYTGFDSRYVNVDGDNMSGKLLIDSGFPNPLELKRDAQVGLKFNNTSDVPYYLGVSSGNLFYGDDLDHSSNDKVFHDGYHPNADKWTIVRTLALTGDASGTVSWDGSSNVTLGVTVADDSHTHDGRYYTETEADNRFVNVTGDTMTGALTINENGDSINLRATTNSTKVGISFSSDVPAVQIGHIRFAHSDSVSYGSGTLLELGSTEPTTTILADGKLMYNEGIYAKPASGTGAGTRKDSNWDTAYTTANAALPKAGGTMTGILYLNDSVEIRLGTDSDFRMSFDGTDTYFRNYAHAGGNIFFQGEDAEGTNTNLIQMINSGSQTYVRLFENSAERLRTLSGGVGVTGLTVGDVDASPHNAGCLQISNSNNEKIVLSGSTDPYIRFQEGTTDKAYIQWNDAGYFDFRNQETGQFKFQSTVDGQASRLILIRNDTTTGTANELGSINFGHTDGNPDYPTQTISQLPVRILAEATETTGSGDDGARLRFFVKATNANKDTSSVEAMRLDQNRVATFYNDLYIPDQIIHTGDTDTYMQFHAANQWRVVVGGNERLEVKSTSPHVYINGTLSSGSDERLKKNIKPLDNSLANICQLEGVTFDWRDDGSHGEGFIAQQVEPIIPGVVNTDEDSGMKSINYVGLISHLVEAIKEQQTQIDALKAIHATSNVASE